MKLWKFLREELITIINAVKVSLDFDFVWGKYHQENAKNGIFESLDFEIFWGSMTSDSPPPKKKARTFGAFAIASVIR